MESGETSHSKSRWIISFVGNLADKVSDKVSSIRGGIGLERHGHHFSQVY